MTKLDDSMIEQSTNVADEEQERYFADQYNLVWKRGKLENILIGKLYGCTLQEFLSNRSNREEPKTIIPDEEQEKYFADQHGDVWKKIGKQENIFVGKLNGRTFEEFLIDQEELATFAMYEQDMQEYLIDEGNPYLGYDDDDDDDTDDFYY